MERNKLTKHKIMHAYQERNLVKGPLNIEYNRISIPMKMPTSIEWVSLVRMCCFVRYIQAQNVVFFSFCVIFLFTERRSRIQKKKSNEREKYLK